MTTRAIFKPETWTCTREGRYFVVRDTKGERVASGDSQRAVVILALLAARQLGRGVRIVDGGAK